MTYLSSFQNGIHNDRRILRNVVYPELYRYANVLMSTAYTDKSNFKNFGIGPIDVCNVTPPPYKGMFKFMW